ncbi:1-phosphofructokinase family hexose kinase [Pseudonocardia alaniniphila]|uniref:PfkB family carbohydrate kinase n=1 Tax=Pseudonocardia alaniniphila TaxID=75291 RepID=A0ABS9TAF0_9PSEU|nr:PfkB family carbohydrate kinase [Pseudonocardia alaniniphila]MCH6165511.1 PfkB family carbohydrate kinase [Pseudonocardia alaniniphila]
MPPTVVVFAPSPLLTVTIEDRAGVPDIHVHAGGQAVWQARMISSLGVPVVLCATLGGEAGDVLGHLLPSEGVELRAVPVDSRNGGYVHDRRDGDRDPIAEAPGSPLDRHEQDALYELMLHEGITHGTALLGGPNSDDVIPAALYARLAADLSRNGCRVAADLSGKRLDAVLEGGPFVIKVSHEELLADGRAENDDPATLVAAMRQLRAEGAGTVIVSRAAEPTLALLPEGLQDGSDVLEIRVPELTPAETRGAGDSMTAGVVASLVQGAPVREALRTGAACGALNVVRRGLGTGGAEAIRALAERVELSDWKK